MSFFSSAKAKLAASKLAEEQLYAQAAEEVSSGQIRQGLWAKAKATSGGGEEATEATYLTLRVEMMKLEPDLVAHAEREFLKGLEQAEAHEVRETELQAELDRKAKLAEIQREAKEAYSKDEVARKRDARILLLIFLIPLFLALVAGLFA